MSIINKTTIGLLCLAALTVHATDSLASSRQASPIAAAYLASRESVFKVHADTGHGTGFLVSDSGLVMTNSHVISRSKKVSVEIRPGLRVPASVLVNDGGRDIAVIAIPPEASEGLRPLSLSPRPMRDLAFPGEIVFALGFPLHQDLLVTQGIVSALEDGGIISDVDINPGNSGGPLLNLDAEVIGVNTFKDLSPTGDGVGGSVAAPEALIVLDSAQRAEQPIVEFKELPTEPPFSFPPESYPWASQRPVEASEYRLWTRQLEEQEARVGKGRNFKRSRRSVSGFFVHAVTPLRSYRETDAYNEFFLRRRRQRESRGVDDDTFDSSLELRHNWGEFVGRNSPLVRFEIYPKIIPTGESVAATLLIGTPTTSLRFDGDLDEAVLMIEDLEVEEVRRIIKMIPRIPSINGIPLRDRAHYGALFYPHEIFRPNFENAEEERGAWLRLRDLDNYGKSVDLEVTRRVKERIWADFEPYRDSLHARGKELKLPRPSTSD